MLGEVKGLVGRVIHGEAGRSVTGNGLVRQVIHHEAGRRPLILTRFAEGKNPCNGIKD